MVECYMPDGENFVFDESCVMCEPHIVGVTSQLKSFFDDAGFQYTADDIAPDALGSEKYKLAAYEYSRSHGVAYKTKRRIAKIIACFVPGYKRRTAVRNWLNRILHVDY